MAKLIQKQSDNILGYTEWWSLGNSCKATISYGKTNCAISVTDTDRNNISTLMAERLSQAAYSYYKTSMTIDCIFLECPKNHVQEILTLLDGYCLENTK